jgi:hypothetical protein
LAPDPDHTTGPRKHPKGRGTYLYSRAGHSIVTLSTPKGSFKIKQLAFGSHMKLCNSSMEYPVPDQVE